MEVLGEIGKYGDLGYLAGLGGKDRGEGSGGGGGERVVTWDVCFRSILELLEEKIKEIVSKLRKYKVQRSENNTK